NRGRITLEGGSAGSLPLSRGVEVFPAHRIAVKNGGAEIKHSKLFIQDGTVKTEHIGEKQKRTRGAGTATIEKGKVVSVTGDLTLKDGKVLAPEDTPVLQPDEYTVSANKVSILWQALAYLLLTVAEILISVTGLELAFVAAPQSMKSFVTA